MVQIPKFSRRARWAVPGGALAVTGAVIAGLLVTHRAGQPGAAVPHAGAQLLAAVSGRTGTLPPFTGTVVENASLGLPQLPGQGYPTSLTSLLTGSHTLRIWYANPSHLRLSVPRQHERERRDHQRSHGLVLAEPAELGHQSPAARGQDDTSQVQLPLAGHADPAAGRAAGNRGGRPDHPGDRADQRHGGRRGPPTSSSSRPRAPSSLIGQVRIAVDGTHHVPLRVQIFARHATQPGVPGGLHVDLVRAARRGELRLHPAARRQGEHATRSARPRRTMARPPADAEGHGRARDDWRCRARR